MAAKCLFGLDDVARTRGEMYVKLGESGGRINLDTVLADSFLTSRTEILDKSLGAMTMKKDDG